MFDIGWSELLIIAVVLIVVVGPKDLPPMLRAFGKTMTRFRKVAGEFRAQFDEALREADLDEVRQHIADAQKLNPAHSLREAMNPLRQMGNDIKADLQRSTMVEQAPSPQMLPLHETSTVEPVPAPVAATEPQPVIAPPPAVVSETIVKPKAVRKPRAKSAPVTTETSAAPIVVKTVEPVLAKATRKPRAKTEALSVEASVPVVTEIVAPSKPTRQPRQKAVIAGEPSVVEPAQVGLPAEKPVRAPRKPAAAVAVAADTPAVDPKKAAAPRKTASKKDDA